MVVGLPLLPPLLRSRPVATLQPTVNFAAVLRHTLLLASVSSRSAGLFCHGWVRGRWAGCRVFMLPPLTPRGHAFFRVCPFRWAYGFFLSAATHLLSACSVYGSPAGNYNLPFARSYCPSTTELDCGVDLWLCLAGSCAPPLLWQNGLRRWAMGGLLTGLVYFVFLSRLGLMFPCFANGLFTVGWGIFLWAARLRRFLVRCFQALGFSCSFYP